MDSTPSCQRPIAAPRPLSAQGILGMKCGDMSVKALPTAGSSSTGWPTAWAFCGRLQSGKMPDEYFNSECHRTTGWWKPAAFRFLSTGFKPQKSECYAGRVASHASFRAPRRSRRDSCRTSSRTACPVHHSCIRSNDDATGGSRMQRTNCTCR